MSSKSAVKICCVIGLVSGTSGLLGWIFDIALLKSLLPNYVEMKANTAISLIVSALSLYLISSHSRRTIQYRLGQIFALFVISMGIATSCEYFFGWDLGIDLLFFYEAPGAFATSNPGRMAVQSAINFVLRGSCLLLIEWETKRGWRPAQYLALFSAFAPLQALIAYGYGVKSLFGLGPYTMVTQMALPVAIAWLGLSFGTLLARPHVGFMRTLMSDTYAGLNARRLLVPAFAVPILIGWLTARGAVQGFYDPLFGFSTLVLTVIIAFSYFIWRSSKSLDQMETNRMAVRAEHDKAEDTRTKNAAAEEAARNVADERDRFFNVSLDMICIAGTNGYYKSVSPACELILGYTPEEMQSRPIFEFLHPDDVKATEQRIKSLYEGTPIRGYENRYRAKDGTFRVLSWTTARFGEDRFGCARDVTERNALQAQLAQADRMISLGSLAAGVAHEINNPLAYTLSNLSLAKERLANASTPMTAENANSVLEMISEAEDGATRVREVMRGLKLFSRNDEEKVAAVDLISILESTIKMASHEILHRARIVKSFSSTPFVRANDGRLGQVFLNLLINAAHAIPESPAEGHEISISTMTDSSGHAVVEIRDSGAGIDPSIIAKIFDPFFTTKPVGVGTGLGLSICRGIITSLGGTIDVSSKLNHGTTFRISLPADHSAPVIAAIQLPPTSALGKKLRILIVDDELLFAKVIQKSLRPDLNAEVCSDSEEALRLILKDEDFDFILCDLMMPRLTGMDIYENLRADGRGLEKKMIFMTGGTFTPRATGFLQEVPNPRLEKPFSIKDFRKLVETAS
jgi:PAS domain S-box-containing protein